MSDETEDFTDGWTGYAPIGADAPIPRCAICGLSAVQPPGPTDPRFQASPYGARSAKSVPKARTNDSSSGKPASPGRASRRGPTVRTATLAPEA